MPPRRLRLPASRPSKGEVVCKEGRRWRIAIQYDYAAAVADQAEDMIEEEAVVGGRIKWRRGETNKIKYTGVHVSLCVIASSVASIIIILILTDQRKANIIIIVVVLSSFTSSPRDILVIRTT